VTDCYDERNLKVPPDLHGRFNANQRSEKNKTKVTVFFSIPLQ
jgi:hypothetical protein